MSTEDLDLRSIQEARRLLARAAGAAPLIAALSQDRIDALLDAMHQAALPLAESWARAAHEETGFGNVPDKTRKNLFATVDVYRHIRPMKTVGVVGEDRERRVLEIAAPAGIVAAIVPSTNPTSTAINKIFIAVKAACPIVVSPHPNARRCVIDVCKVLGEAAVAAGAPEGTVGCMTHVAIEGTRELMRHPLTRLVLATGGTGLVRAAYSSGKPAFGVGPGNVPAYVDRSADTGKAARDIVSGKTFDNGVLCSAENAVVVDAPAAEALAAAMRAEGCLFLDAAQTAALSRVTITPAGILDTRIVGRDAATIARLAGIDAPPGTRCLVAPQQGVGPEHPFSREKLSPILAWYVADGWEAACALCHEILAYGGMGHTMAIHARDRDVILKFALAKPVFRIVVNTPAAVGAVGVTTGVEPSMTLGCGALGGNITSDNITPRHLINLKRLAFETRSFQGETVLSPLETPRPQAMAAAQRPAAAPPPPAPPPTDLRRRVEAALRDRALPGEGAPPGSSGAPREPAAGRSAAPERSSPAPAAFVCEEDVRKAIAGDRKIVVSSRTIVTPSARDLASAHRVFVEV
jgi:acetaldehyde dehydrogenase (acetylating)